VSIHPGSGIYFRTVASKSKAELTNEFPGLTVCFLGDDGDTFSWKKDSRLTLYYIGVAS
jgi:hypothetical protein